MWKILVLIYMCTSDSMAQLDIVYEWNELDFKFSSPVIREMMIKDGSFIPKNNVPSRMEVHQNKLFVNIPRGKKGVPVSLAFVDLADRSSKSPKFIPYPTWGAHYKDSYNEPQIADAENIRADRCDRLWVLDNGTYPALKIFDLKVNKIIRRYAIPADQVFAYLNVMAIEDVDCENTYAYVVDKYESKRIAVYSWAKNDSWLIIWDKYIGGLALAPTTNTSTLYFTTKYTYELFSISTEYLRNASIAKQSIQASKFLGKLGSESRLGNIFIDAETNVLFYLAGNGSNVEHGQYEVACWATNKEYNVNTIGAVPVTNHTLFPLNEIKVDKNSLWVLSIKLPWSLNHSDINFRLFSAPVLNVINNTVCDIPVENN